MATVHWLGAGLSSTPGIRRLASGPHPLILWNRSVDKAAMAVASLSETPVIRALDMTALARTIAPGDVLVSMLPADMHLQIARLALAQGAHFISSSYVSPELLELHSAAAGAELSFVNEVGLDPGIDHLMAHRLLHEFREHGPASERQQLRFRSYCGGFPAVANEFRYKFSWSPVGVLRALRAPSRCIVDSQIREASRPWHGLSEYRARLPGGEEHFEAYANRDSLPFVKQYQLDPAWPVQQFVRGTLRLPGWANAWQPLFTELDTLEVSGTDARLQELSDHLWQQYRYRSGEADRVVLCVELEAVEDKRTVWHGGLCIDARGNAQSSAMARLVSHTVSLAVDSVIAGELPSGVTAAPSDVALIGRWFASLEELGDTVHTLPPL